MGVYWDTAYEQESINSGISLRQQETGVEAQWWFWDPQDSQVDDIYDEGLPGRTLRWRGPFVIPVFDVHRVEGTAIDAGEGSYGVDSIRLVLGYGQATSAGLLPPVDFDRDRSHLKDRFTFDHKVWSPSSIVAHNRLGGRGTRSTIIVEATEVRDDELVNDVQFAKFAERGYVEPYVPRLGGTPSTGWTPPSPLDWATALALNTEVARAEAAEAALASRPIDGGGPNDTNGA